MFRPRPAPSSPHWLPGVSSCDALSADVQGVFPAREPASTTSSLDRHKGTRHFRRGQPDELSDSSCRGSLPNRASRCRKLGRPGFSAALCLELSPAVSVSSCFLLPSFLPAGCLVVSSLPPFFIFILHGPGCLFFLVKACCCSFLRPYPFLFVQTAGQLLIPFCEYDPI